MSVPKDDAATMNGKLCEPAAGMRPAVTAETAMDVYPFVCEPGSCGPNAGLHGSARAGCMASNIKLSVRFGQREARECGMVQFFVFLTKTYVVEPDRPCRVAADRLACYKADSVPVAQPDRAT